MNQKKPIVEPPPDTPEYMYPAWLDCLRWAAGKPEILEQFRQETDNRWTPPQHPIEQMIDQAAGAEADFVQQFVQWFNQNVWGSIDDN